MVGIAGERYTLYAIRYIPMQYLNISLAQWLFGLAHRAAPLDAVLIFFASALPYLLGIGFFIFLAGIKKRRERLLLFFETLLILLLSRGIITEGIRFFYHSPRPFETWQATPLVSETLGNSFPSGHGVFFFALAMSLFFYHRKWGIWYFVLAALMGIARIAAGVHWPIDIIGGALIGIVSAFLIHILFKKTWSALHISPASPPPAMDTPTPQEHNEGAA